MIDNISWLAVYPEIVLLVMACVIALVDLWVKSPRRTATYVLTMLTLAVVAALEGVYASSGNTFYGFGNMVVSDAMGNWLKCFATIAVMVTLVYSRPYAADRDMLRGGEMFTLSMFALLGMFIMISGNNFLVIYLGLELLTLSSYALVALRRDHATASEAAMISSLVAPGLPNAILSLRVREKRKISCSMMEICERSDAKFQSRTSTPSTSTCPSVTS